MADQILYVDDEPNVLSACKRSLGRTFKITTATSGAEGLELIRAGGEFAVVLSDMRMPEMDGLDFICAVRQQTPDTVCMMLTGNSDQETAMNAVNKGQIFRFLTKPCPPDVLQSALEAGIKQYRLVTAERELLQKTLTGSIKTLAEVLELVNPKSFARGNRIRSVVKALIAELKLEQAWQYEIAAILSQIGCIVLPPQVIEKVFSRNKLTNKEAEIYASHPDQGARLLQHIPRMELCARMISGQLKRYADMDTPDPRTADGAVLLGSQILHAATDFDGYLTRGLDRQMAIAAMRDRDGVYNPDLLSILGRLSIPGLDEDLKEAVQEITVWQVTVGMYANADIVTLTGTLLVPKGNEITKPLIARLRNFASGVGVREPICVRVPQGRVADAA